MKEVCLSHKTILKKIGEEKSKKVKVKSRPTLCDPMDSSLHQAPPSMGFSRQEYWSGLPFPYPGNLPDPGNEPSLWHCRQMIALPYCS